MARVIEKLPHSLTEVTQRLHGKLNGNVKYYTSPYNPKTAQLIAKCWRMSPRHAKRKNNDKLYRHVIQRLKQGDSPDIIAGRLEKRFPHNLERRVSHETIYRWIYDNRLNGGALSP